MEGSKRRDEIIWILKKSQEPVCGTALARQLGVSRQVVVQDIALLRAVNQNILSTTRGYVLYEQMNQAVQRYFHVWHTTEQIEDELCTIIDLGGKVENVMVTHSVYGEISAPLILSNRQDIKVFRHKIEEYQGVPLKDLSDGTHYHRVSAESEEILNCIEEALDQKGYLL